MQANAASTLLLSWCAGSFGKKGNDRTFDHWVRTTQDVLACVSDEIEALVPGRVQASQAGSSGHGYASGSHNYSHVIVSRGFCGWV